MKVRWAKGEQVPYVRRTRTVITQRWKSHCLGLITNFNDPELLSSLSRSWWMTRPSFLFSYSCRRKTTWHGIIIIQQRGRDKWMSHGSIEDRSRATWEYWGRGILSIIIFHYYTKTEMTFALLFASGPNASTYHTQYTINQGKTSTNECLMGASL